MILIIFFLLILLADQYTKLIVQQDMIVGQSIPVIHKIFHFTYVQNSGGAFGILRGRTNLFIIISIIVILFIVYFMFKEEKKDYFVKVVCAFVLGGAISNLIDRIRLGYVVDFVDFQVWPVFNIADSAISIGMVLLFIRLFFKKDEQPINRQVEGEK
ncbi:MAG: signal peptidase II [bacterium]|nr:signal peptidase II [bacterium]MDD5757158.1 signal peptidase II [bacterium]